MWKELCNNLQQQTEPLIVFSEHTHPIESPQKADGLTQIQAIWPQAPVEVVHLIHIQLARGQLAKVRK